MMISKRGGGGGASANGLLTPTGTDITTTKEGGE